MAITVDQASLGSNAGGGSATTVTLTTTNAVAAGGFIVLGIGNYGAGQFISSVSGGGLTWTVDLTDSGGLIGTNPTAGIATAPAPSGLAASTVITVTFSAATESRHVCGASFLGVDLADPLDVAGALGEGSASSSWASGSLSVQAGSMVVGVAFNEDNRTSTPTSPSSELFDFNANGTERLILQYRIESSGGSYASGGTWSGSTSHSHGAVAYNEGDAPPDAPNRDYSWHFG